MNSQPPESRDYHGCIWMYLDVYPQMMDKKVWIMDTSMDIHNFLIIWLRYYYSQPIPLLRVLVAAQPHSKMIVTTI
jgi:hypothetical protein